jgi:hypothetical protein
MVRKKEEKMNSLRWTNLFTPILLVGVIVPIVAVTKPVELYAEAGPGKSSAVVVPQLESKNRVADYIRMISSASTKEVLGHSDSYGVHLSFSQEKCDQALALARRQAIPQADKIAADLAEALSIIKLDACGIWLWVSQEP